VYDYSVLKLKQLEQAKTAVVGAAQDTQKMVLAALGVALLSLLVAVAAMVMCVRARTA
jgi:hypothetical protein